MKYALFFFLCFNSFLFSQEEVKETVEIITDTFDYDDEVDVEIAQVDFWAKPVFKDIDDNKRFLYLKRKVHKVWPYVRMAHQLYDLNEEQTAKLEKKRLVKKYNREIQDSLMTKYKKKLKKFSRTDGRVMMKLIHRQTGETIYDIVKKSKSGWSAFWWNKQANLFKLNMKDTLDVKNNRDDYFVEYITNDGILKGYLKEND